MTSLPRARRGMTLIELMMAITILAIVGSAVMSVLTSQQQFYRDANEMVNVRRELRASASLLPTELRGVSSIGGDISRMDDSAFYFNANYGSAVACAIGTRTMDIPPTDLELHTLSSWYSEPRAGDTIFVFDDGPLPGAVDDSWFEAEIASFASLGTTCAQAAFLDPAGGDAGKPGWRITTLNSGPAFPATIDVGAAIRFSRPVRYSIYQPTVGAGEPWYLGYREMQTDGEFTDTDVIGGPFRDYSANAATTGVRFNYFDVTNNPTTSMAALSRVDVQMRGQALIPSALSGNVIGDSILFRVALRNRN